LLKIAREIGPGTGIVNWYRQKAPLDCTVHVSTNCVRGACTGTRFYQLCLDQSEITLKVGRTQDKELKDERFTSA